MKSLIAPAFLAILALSGCGEAEPPMGAVSGKVTVGGEFPKEATRVNFVNNSIGQGSGANVADDGSFSLDQRLPPADYVVFLTKIPEQSDSPSSTASEILKSVPKEFRSEETSSLKFTVKAGSNEFDVVVPALASKTK